MKIIRNTKPISDLYNGMKSGDIIINREYQRSSGLWPNNSRSYFIDTILNEFPFPKVVLWQKVDLKTKKTRIEIIDGQQRLSTIRDFIDNKIRLSSVSKNFVGKIFEDLEDYEQQAFLSYEVSLDSILSGTREEVLEIFKRINSYTLALNKAEQRFATYQGEFKWFISDLTTIISPFLGKYNVLTERELSRMQDDDLLAECCLQYIEGVKSRSSKKIDDLYKENDVTFPLREEMWDVMVSTYDFIKNNLVELFEQCDVKSYNFYSLLGALIYNRYGFKSQDNDIQFEPQGRYCNDNNQVLEDLIRMFSAIDQKDIDGEYAEIVRASSASTHTIKNRKTRFNAILQILQRA